MRATEPGLILGNGGGCHCGNEEVSAGAAGVCGAVVPGVGAEAGDPASGRAAERAPGGAAELDPARPRPITASATIGRRRRCWRRTGVWRRRTPNFAVTTLYCVRRVRFARRRSTRPGGGHEVIDAHDFPVGLVLRVLDIASSTYYDWRARATLPARRRREDAELLGLIDEVRASHEFAGTYGSPRVWLELRRRGVRVSRKRVERIMRENDRRGVYLRKGWKGGSTKQNPRHIAVPDLLDRDFTATAPNRKWVAVLTRIPTGEGVLWLASVRDAFSNKVVGWRTGPRADTDLVLSAFDYALSPATSVAGS